MLSNEVSKEQVMHFAELLQKEFPYNMEVNQTFVKKGFHLYRQGSVYNVRYEDNLVVGRVQDVVPVDVKLDLDFFNSGYCSCEMTHFCRHRMALFFYIYSTMARVGSLLDEWKTAHLVKDPSRITQTLIKAKDIQKPFEDDSLSSWLTFFNNEYDKFINQHQQDRYLISLLYQRFFQSLIQKAPKSIELKRLYSIHAAIFCVEKISETTDYVQIKHFQLDSYVTPYVHNLIDRVIDELAQLKVSALPFSLDPLLEESMNVIREKLLSNQLFLFERFTIYRGIWSSLFNRSKWLQAEQLILGAEKESNGRTLALAHLAFLEKKDEAAIESLRSLGSPFIMYSLGWLRALSSTSDWERARVWVEFTSAHIRDYVYSISAYDGRRHIVRTYLNEIATYCEINDQEIYVDTMKRLLPYSFVQYDHYLLNAQSYRKWVDLQLVVGYDISECDRHVIKEIETNNRPALLPFYHQSVVKALSQKNRVSYRLAVRYLRKIRTTYRRMNQVESWETYIEKLSLSYKRLRAFQEELQKAKLITE